MSPNEILVEGGENPKRAEGRNNGRRGRPVRRKQPGNHEEAKRIQQLYSKNRKVAIQEIRQEESPLCNLPPEDVANFFEHVFSERLTALDAAPEGVVLPKTQGHDESVFAEFSKDVIAARLRHCSNTAPGPDGITYSILRSKDPGCHVLYEIFERCRKERRVPTAWKAARTILLYKKGERKDLSNWRPISLSSCIYKVYSGILAARLARWAATSGAISSVQKGFMPAEGCLEHNFTVQECIDMAKTGTELVLTWLDLRNAFGSVPHVAIFELLQRHGVSSLFIEALREMYDGCSTTITTETGETRSVPMKSGVKQGDPLSPIVFNLAIEVLLLTALQLKDTHGFSLFGRSIISLAYADDIVLIAKNPEAMQEILQEVSKAASWMGLEFNAAKCATLHIKTRKARKDTDTYIQGQRIPTLDHGEAYQHLGVPTGLYVEQTPEATFQKMIEDLQAVEASLLTPWQKLDAIRTFIIPQAQFTLLTANIKQAGPPFRQTSLPAPLCYAGNSVRQGSCLLGLPAAFGRAFGPTPKSHRTSS
ncbi:Retrovirus-related Pol polyprotein from type-1 retrotransposable element R2 [Frankliniella fusca]|uniref:Retrovirus-related Pol polyprotein from type-1 retrotransposable element R2 n=1 Tax=Frankliniella fusca TaxID=407009 RepID=A0AAE1GTS0_9NEOP|nr:Retrovirus-related Pol polyprotein from type-1 retrotransposable element R2 [Frankliniella fusca]